MTIRCHMYKAIGNGQRSRRCIHYANQAIAGCDLLVGRSCIEWARSNSVSISQHPFNLEAAQGNLEAAGLTQAELGTSPYTPEQRKQGAAYAKRLQRQRVQAPMGQGPGTVAPESIELEAEHAEKIVALREIFPQGVITIKKG